MQIRYLGEVSDAREESYSLERALAEKQNLKKNHDERSEVKFCVIRADQDILFIFRGYLTHAHIVTAFLESKGLGKDRFICAGTIKEKLIIFKSLTCKMEFGRDFPDNPDLVERQMEDVLIADGFYTER